MRQKGHRLESLGLLHKPKWGKWHLICYSFDAPNLLT